jgi:outer membrane protein assembly factor BamA
MERWLLLLVALMSALRSVDAFVPPKTSWNGRDLSSFGYNGNSNHQGPQEPPPPPQWSGSHAFHDDALQLLAHNDTLRGGASSSSNSNSDDIIKGAQATLQKSANFWKTSMGNLKHRISSLFQSKETKKEQELLQQLQSMPVRHVVVPETTVLPPQVIAGAVARSGIIGSPLRTDRVQALAKQLKQWYLRKGYVLHTVTGATLKPETATAEITVEEPRISQVPVKFTFCKEMVIDSETGELVTFKQYRDKHVSRKTFGYDRLDRKSLNTTFVETKGRTSPIKIAKALKLLPGRPFQWDGGRWQQISRSGIFSRVLQTSPERMPDGTVSLQVYVTEAAPRHLEYGLGKSLYTGSWEGEIDFEHLNLFGGGETIGVVVKRGTKDAEPSVRLRYSDENFGLEGGYDIDVFSDFIGDKMDFKGEDTNAHDYESDALLDRRGATVRLRNPISTHKVRNSVASACLERTSTRTGLHESIGSGTLTLGPFRKLLPMDARSSIATTLTTGSRFVDKAGTGEGEVQEPQGLLPFHLRVLPYSSISATTKQVLPLSSASRQGRPPLILALQHTISTSTHNLPRHEANAMGFASEIRGVPPNGRACSSVKGTTELRVPFTVPKFGDASVVLFGDWFFVQKDLSSKFYSKSSVGVGFRKNVQGLPLKYDVCYSSEGKVKTMFGLGPDFDV